MEKTAARFTSLFTVGYSALGSTVSTVASHFGDQGLSLSHGFMCVDLFHPMFSPVVVQFPPGILVSLHSAKPVDWSYQGACV